jgi:hypothetical protein
MLHFTNTVLCVGKASFIRWCSVINHPGSRQYNTIPFVSSCARILKRRWITVPGRCLWICINLPSYACALDLGPSSPGRRRRRHGTAIDFASRLITSLSWAEYEYTQTRFHSENRKGTQPPNLLLTPSAWWLSQIVKSTWLERVTKISFSSTILFPFTCASFFWGPFIHESSSPPSILINTSVAFFTWLVYLLLLFRTQIKETVRRSAQRSCNSYYSAPTTNKVQNCRSRKKNTKFCIHKEKGFCQNLQFSSLCMVLSF